MSKSCVGLICLGLYTCVGYASGFNQAPPANENTCASDLEWAWPHHRPLERARFLSPNGKLAKVVGLHNDYLSRVRAAGEGTRAAQKAHEALAVALATPPFVMSAGPNLVQVLGSPGDPEITLKVEPIEGGSRRTFHIQTEFMLHPIVASPDGRFLVLASLSELSFRVVDLQSGRVALTSDADLPLNAAGKIDIRYHLHAAFSGDSRYLTITHPNLVEVFELKRFKPHKVLHHELEITAVDETSADKDLGGLPPGFRGRVEFMPVAHETPDASRLFILYEGHSPRIVDLRMLRAMEIGVDAEWALGDVGLVDPAAHVAFAAFKNPHQLGSWINVISLDDGHTRRSLQAFNLHARRLALSPSGRYLAAAGCQNGGVIVFDLAAATHLPRYQLECRTGNGFLLDFAGEHQVVCGDRDLGEAYVFDLQ